MPNFREKSGVRPKNDDQKCHFSPTNSQFFPKNANFFSKTARKLPEIAKKILGQGKLPNKMPDRKKLPGKCQIWHLMPNQNFHCRTPQKTARFVKSGSEKCHLATLPTYETRGTHSKDLRLWKIQNCLKGCDQVANLIKFNKNYLVIIS